MNISDKHDGSFPRKSNNETVTPYQSKVLKLKAKDNSKKNEYKTIIVD